MAIQNGFSFNDAEYPLFDPEDYWGSREFKVWVVTLRHVTRRGKRQRRVYDFTHKYVRARTPETAAQVARRNHFGREKICGIGVRLATPSDLGAVPIGGYCSGYGMNSRSSADYCPGKIRLDELRGRDDGFTRYRLGVFVS